MTTCSQEQAVILVLQWKTVRENLETPSCLSKASQLGRGGLDWFSQMYVS